MALNFGAPLNVPAGNVIASNSNGFAVLSALACYFAYQMNNMRIILHLPDNVLPVHHRKDGLDHFVQGQPALHVPHFLLHLPVDFRPALLIYFIIAGSLKSTGNGMHDSFAISE